MQGQMTFPKTVALVFGLFAILAITSSSSIKAQTKFDVARHEKLAKVEQAKVETKPEPVVLEATDKAVAEKPVEKTVAVEQEATVKSDVIAVHLFLHHGEAKADAAAIQAGQVKQTVQAQEEVRKHKSHSHDKPEAPAANTTAAEPAAATTTSKAAQTGSSQVKVQPVSAMVLVIPTLALVGAVLAVKYRKPGFLPVVLEERLESAGFPAASNHRSNFNSWTGSSPSRSVYGSL